MTKMRIIIQAKNFESVSVILTAESIPTENPSQLKNVTPVILPKRQCVTECQRHARRLGDRNPKHSHVIPSTVRNCDTPSGRIRNVEPTGACRIGIPYRSDITGNRCRTSCDRYRSTNEALKTRNTDIPEGRFATKSVRGKHTSQAHSGQQDKWRR